MHQLLGGCLLAVAAVFSGPVQAESPARIPKIVLAGPFAAVSYPLIHMLESGALKDIAETVEFAPWKDPDQLRVLAIEGKADFVAMPTNVAANLYNRGVKLQLLNVSTWGVLWMVSRENNLQTLADFKGKEIAMPFRADMPDIIFQALAEKQGLDVKRDFKLRSMRCNCSSRAGLIMPCLPNPPSPRRYARRARFRSASSRPSCIAASICNRNGAA